MLMHRHTPLVVSTVVVVVEVVIVVIVGVNNSEAIMLEFDIPQTKCLAINSID